MRFEEITVRGLGPFRGEIHLDLTSIPGQLVAVTGENGAGKSTLLELLVGALDRECPTRGTLASLATRRDAMVEVRAVNGSPWTIRQLVDATSGKGESVALDASGAPVTPSGKVREFDAWRAKHLPSASVLRSTIFAAQGSSGFLGMKPADRKSLLLRILGIEHLEQLAAKAREHQRSAEGEASTLGARLADEHARGGDVAAAAADVAAKDAELSRARADLEAARVVLEDARLAHSAAVAEWEASQAKAAELRRLSAEFESAKARQVSAEADAAKAQETLEHATPISALEAAVATACKALDTAKATHATEVAGYEAAQVAVRRQRELLDAKKDRETRAANNRAILANADAVREAVALVAELDREIGEAAAAVEAAEAALRETQELRAAGAEERIVEMRHGLEFISTGEESNPADTAMDYLRKDDAAVALAESLPSSIHAARDSLSEAQGRVRDLQARRALASQQAAMAPKLEAAEARLAELGEEIGRLDVQLSELGEVRSPPRPREEPVQQAAAVLSRAESALASGREETAAAERVLASTGAQLSELRPQLERLRSELQSLQGVAVALRPDPGSLDAAAARVAQREEELQKAMAASTRAAAALEAAQQSAERAAALELELAAARTTVADWTRLAADLGRDGIQALEIDAAGPELTAIANQLLHECHGPRWTVSIETQRLSADGKRTIEGCEVRVLDSERGREAPAETLSGGEAVLVSEAVSLALSTVACRRQGVTRPTLVRDESGAALSANNSRAWVAMIRRAARLVDADRVLIVSHTPEVWDLCDSRVHVAHGEVTVQA